MEKKTTFSIAYENNFEKTKSEISISCLDFFFFFTTSISGLSPDVGSSGGFDQTP